MNENTMVWSTILPGDFALEPLPRPTILVVDDRDENLVAMRRVLERLDADIVGAHSGAEALSLTLRQDFAVILLDVQMPVMDGFETADLLRQNDETAKTPIIFVTAISKEDRYVVQGYDVGAVDYIFKPLDPAILLSKVRVFLDLERQRLMLKRLVHNLEELNARHALLLEAAAEGIIGVDAEGHITFANPAAQRLLTAENLLVGTPVLTYLEGRPVAEADWREHGLRRACVDQRRIERVEAMLFRPDGSRFSAEYSFAPLPARTGIFGGVLVLQDISLRKALQERLVRMAQYDELTGVANRHLFFELLDKAVARARRSQGRVSLLFIDLDGFKPVNDRLGHRIGDLALRGVADRFTHLIRKGDLLARMGGDEFALLLESSTNGQAEHVAAKLIQSFEDSFTLEGHQVMLGVSIGIACFPDHAPDAGSLISRADEAMYAAKKEGGNRWKMVG